MATVLYIEESHLARTVARLALERAGHRVIEATDGQSGLDAVAMHAPDCVLVNLSAPVIDGVEFLRRVRQRQSPPPVVIVAACPSSRTIEECRRLGARAVIDRPWAGDTFAATVSTALGSLDTRVAA